MILGILILACGVGSFVLSDYIAKEVIAGRAKIAAGQSKVNDIDDLVDKTSRMPGLSGIVTGSSQDEINAGHRKANYYDRLSHKVKIGGIVLVVIAAILFFFEGQRKKWWPWSK